MKKAHLLLVFSFVLIAVALVSWGAIGHRTVGKIAQNHLTPKALAGVRDLLGDASLADVSTWADEVRRQPEYKQTAPWHYIDLPLGLTYDQFRSRVENMLESNVYSALGQQMQLITDKTVPKEKKIEALKFIVHFVGDLHQPMHISRSEDEGGNTIQLNYEGRGTNLHSVWDSKLIEHSGMDYEQLAAKYDHPTAAQVKQWQTDPVVKWMWESYQISSRLYAEVDSMKSRSIGEAYYNEHWATIAQRLEQAGVRLAGLLNVLFKDGPVAYGPSVPGATAGVSAGAGAGASAGTSAGVGAGQPVTIDIRDIGKYVNQYVTVSSFVYGVKDMGSFSLVNLGAEYPNQLLTVVLRGDAKALAGGLLGKTIQVTGNVELYKEKPEIVVKDAGKVVVK